MSLSPKTRRRLEVTVGNSAIAKEIADSVDATAKATTAPINLSVDVNGSDTNPTTSFGPYKTIQAAVDSLPKLIKHPVTITVGAGNFTGAVLSNFSTLWTGSSAVPGSLVIQGTLIPATLATGLATGTVTATAAQGTSGSAVTFATLTDSTQTWTTDNLKGKVLEITSGTKADANAFFIIASNTATVITLAGDFANGAARPANGDSYAIRDFGTIIDTSTPNLSGLLLDTQTGAGIYVQNCNSQLMNTTHGFFVLSKLKIAPTTNSAVRVDGPSQLGIKWCSMTASSGTIVVFGTQGAMLKILFSHMIGVGASRVVAVGANNDRSCMGLAMNNCLIEGGSHGVTAGGMPIAIDRTLIQNQTTAGIALGTGGSARFDMNFGKISVPSGTGFTTQLTAGAGPAMMAISLNGINVSDCAKGFDLDHGNACLYAVNLSGSNNTIAINLTKGARVQISSASAITGTTEVSVDGSTTTLAAMRALNPKAFPATPNAFGTIIYE